MLKKHMFSRAYPIRIFDFPSLFVNEADTLKMREAQSFTDLPHFVENPAEPQYRANLSGDSCYGGITCCSGAVQYILRTYAKPTTIREALDNLRSIRQRAE